MECYACGNTVEALSERQLCQQCEAGHQDGEARAEYIVERASRLEEARESNDLDTVKQIVAEIAEDGVQQSVPSVINMQPQAGVE